MGEVGFEQIPCSSCKTYKILVAGALKLESKIQLLLRCATCGFHQILRLSKSKSGDVFYT